MKVENMIAGKTHSEILLMERNKRHLWYKTISFKAKEEAMRVVEVSRRAKNSVLHKNKIVSEETKIKIRMSWTSERRVEKKAIMIEQWKDPKYRDKMNRVGENSPNYIDGRKSDPQYQRRYILRSLGLPDEFVELALHQKKKRTDIELIMEYWLLNNRISYEFQRYIKLPSTYTKVDFFIEPNICLYCDGNHYHELGKIRERDERITKELESMNYRVIRIWGSDIHDGVRPWEIFRLSRLKYEQQLLGLREQNKENIK